MWMISDLVVAVIVVVVQSAMRNDVALAQRIRGRTPPAVFEYAGLVVLFATMVRGGELLINFKRLVTDDEHSIRVYRILAVFEGVRVTALAVLLMYGFGAVDIVAGLLARSILFLSERSSYLVSTGLGWIASGVTGNFVYDLLRRSVTSRRGRSAPASSRLRYLASKMDRRSPR
jgi:hypothetical protein